jgi:[DsrC]-trisulfide reductase subunit J
MNLRRGVFVTLVVVPVALSIYSLVPLAAQDEDTTTDSRVPMPVIARGEGESCVEDTDFMRRNHMTLLLHQRDETMREGIRGEPYSLKECVACHAVDDSDGEPLTAASPEHFCRSCHDYAAVKIDCFECHASRPLPDALPEDHGETLVGSARE